MQNNSLEQDIESSDDLEIKDNGQFILFFTLIDDVISLSL